MITKVGKNWVGPALQNILFSMSVRHTHIVLVIFPWQGNVKKVEMK